MSSIPSTYGPNIAFIEELYEKYRTDPDAVSASWREFFADYQPVFEEEHDALEQPHVPSSRRRGAPCCAWSRAWACRSRRSARRSRWRP